VSYVDFISIVNSLHSVLHNEFTQQIAELSWLESELEKKTCLNSVEMLRRV